MIFWNISLRRFYDGGGRLVIVMVANEKRLQELSGR